MRRQAPGRSDEEAQVHVRQSRQGIQERDTAIEHVWQVTETALGYEEGKNNGFKLHDFKHKKTRSRSSRQRYMQVFSCP